MPAGLIDEQRSVSARRDLGGDFGQVQVHRLGVASRHDKGCALAVFGTNRAEDISGGGSLVVGSAGARAAFGPTAGDLDDRNDVEAICEAVGRPSMRFVPRKSTDQLAVQAVHRIRGVWSPIGSGSSNQIRGLLSEHGIVIARDIAQLRRGLAVVVGTINYGLSEMVRALMRDLQAELAELDARIAAYDRRIKEIFRASEQCRRLGKIEGIGPVTATALVAAVGDRSCFKKGRQFAAWLGLAPKQRSSGGRARLFGISKRGDRYLRTLMIHGARAALKPGQRQAGSTKPLARQDAATAPQCRGRCSRQQEWADRVGYAHQREMRARALCIDASVMRRYQPIYAAPPLFRDGASILCRSGREQRCPASRDFLLRPRAKCPKKPNETEKLGKRWMFGDLLVDFGELLLLPFAFALLTLCSIIAHRKGSPPKPLSADLNERPLDGDRSRGDVSETRASISRPLA